MASRKHHRQSKIGQLDIGMPVEQHIGRLDVEMGNVQLHMAVVHGTGQLSKQSARLAFTQHTAVQHIVVQVAATGILHDSVHGMRRGNGLMQPRNVRMTKLRKHIELVAHTLLAPLIVRHNLDGRLPDARSTGEQRSCKRAHAVSNRHTPACW